MLDGNNKRAATPFGMTALFLLDGDPDGFAFVLGFDDLLFEFVEPFARFEELADELVTTDEDAASGVGGGVTHVDADAFEEVVEVGATEKDREPHFKLRTPSNHYGITALWDGEGL